MPKFTKTVEELTTRFDNRLFVLRNLRNPERILVSFREKIFEKLFDTAEIARFTPEQVLACEDSLKYYRDLKNSFDTARSEGRQEGLKEGLEEGMAKGMEKGKMAERQNLARNALSMGISIPEIAKLTGLMPEQIEKLK